MGDHPPLPSVTDAYARFTRALDQGRTALFASRMGLEAVDTADGESFLAQLVEGALVFLHADPARPAWVPWTTPTRRWMDNGPDSTYWMAPTDSGHRYRITGRRGDECYLSFTLYGGEPGHPERVLRNVNHLELGAAAGQPFSFDLAPPDDACYVICRQYFLRPATDRPAQLHIAADGPSARVPDEAALAARWDAATSFLRAMTIPRAPGAAPPRYVSTTPNVMGDPSVWRADEGGGRGTPDQTYASGPFCVPADHALVLRVRFPRAAYASATLWNRFSQSVDSRFHRSTINASQAVAGPDGQVEIVVAHRDPGVPNWLDTGGRSRGTVFWRFLLAAEPPGPIGSSIVPLSSLTSR